MLEDTVASLGDGVGVVFVSNAKLALDDELPHDSIWSVDGIAMVLEPVVVKEGIDLSISKPMLVVVVELAKRIGDFGRVRLVNEVVDELVAGVLVTEVGDAGESVRERARKRVGAVACDELAEEGERLSCAGGWCRRSERASHGTGGGTFRRTQSAATALVRDIVAVDLFALPSDVACGEACVTQEVVVSGDRRSNVDTGGAIDGRNLVASFEAAERKENTAGKTDAFVDSVRVVVVEVSANAVVILRATNRQKDEVGRETLDGGGPRDGDVADDGGALPIAVDGEADGGRKHGGSTLGDLQDSVASNLDAGALDAAILGDQVREMIGDEGEARATVDSDIGHPYVTVGLDGVVDVFDCLSKPPTNAARLADVDRKRVVNSLSQLAVHAAGLDVVELDDLPVIVDGGGGGSASRRNKSGESRPATENDEGEANDECCALREDDGGDGVGGLDSSVGDLVEPDAVGEPTASSADSGTHDGEKPAARAGSGGERNPVLGTAAAISQGSVPTTAA